MNTAENRPVSLVPDVISEEITEADEQIFFDIISTDLNDRQKQQIITPPAVYPRQDTVLAVHWHPEFVPMPLIKQRIDAMFPNKRRELIIPTQHNEIMSYNGYSGVEVDCYSQGFNQKVQLLLHFETPRLENAHMLRDMLAHTFKYRSSQLFDFLHTLTAPVDERIDEAARDTGASDGLIRFVQAYSRKIEQLIDRNISGIPPQSIKNKLIRNFFDGLRPQYGDPLIGRAQTFLNAIKAIVKRHFSLQYFYRTSEVIEEARHLNAGIVIPHPEQFWPVLMAGYDVDGVEVWNPQSHRYTEFLVSVINDQNNRRAGTSRRQLLIFMGDDTHMGEKTRDPETWNHVKASREIGFQPAWDDLSICKSLIMARCNREKVIEEYKSRLAG